MGIFLGFIQDLYKAHGFNPGLIGLSVGFIFEEEEVKEN
jgi:hypothetical protein